MSLAFYLLRYLLVRLVKIILLTNVIQIWKVYFLIKTVSTTVWLFKILFARFYHYKQINIIILMISRKAFTSVIYDLKACFMARLFQIPNHRPPLHRRMTVGYHLFLSVFFIICSILHLMILKFLIVVLMVFFNFSILNHFLRFQLFNDQNFA